MSYDSLERIMADANYATVYGGWEAMQRLARKRKEPRSCPSCGKTHTSMLSRFCAGKCRRMARNVTVEFDPQTFAKEMANALQRQNIHR